MLGYIRQVFKSNGNCLPANEMLCFFTDVYLFGEVEIVGPIDDFLIRVSRVLRAEWCIAYQTLIHDCA